MPVLILYNNVILVEVKRKITFLYTVKVRGQKAKHLNDCIQFSNDKKGDKKLQIIFVIKNGQIIFVKATDKKIC